MVGERGWVIAEKLAEWQPGRKEWGYRRDQCKRTSQGCPDIVSYFLQLGPPGLLLPSPKDSILLGIHQRMNFLAPSWVSLIVSKASVNLINLIIKMDHKKRKE